MEPTLHDNDKVIVEIFPYLFDGPEYRDIVAFPFPGDPSRNFVKRIIGKPGDVIDIDSDSVYVNGERLDDEFAELPPIATGSTVFPLTVSPDHYFVLGDNRSVSKDSRDSEVGCIERQTIIGKVYFRVLPFDKIGFLR